MVRLTLAIAGCLVVVGVAEAQYTQGNLGRNTTSTYGAFGSRTLGGGVGSSSSGFSSGRTTGNLGGSNTIGSGGSLNRSGGMGQQMGAAGSTTNGFSLGGTLPQQQGGFVGADRGDAVNLRSMQGQQGAQGMNQLGSLFGPQGAFSQFARQNQQRQNQGRNQNGQQDKKALRFAIKADIPTSNVAMAATNVSRQLETRLTKLPALEQSASVRVTMQGRTAILSGSVGSERERRLVEGLAMLEPGISEVQNELEVVEAPTRAEELPVPRQ